MAQLRDCASFTQKARAIVVRIRIHRRKLDGYATTEMRILSEVDSPHTTLTEGLKNAVM
jgi:hypothetical protein